MKTSTSSKKSDFPSLVPPEITIDLDASPSQKPKKSPSPKRSTEDLVLAPPPLLSFDDVEVEVERNGNFVFFLSDSKENILSNISMIELFVHKLAMDIEFEANYGVASEMIFGYGYVLGDVESAMHWFIEFSNLANVQGMFLDPTRLKNIKENLV